MEHKKQSFNFLRKSWHVLGLIIPLILYWDFFKGWNQWEYATRTVLVSLLFLTFVLLVFFEILRFQFPGFSEFFWRLFGPLMKESEKSQIHGTVPYILANLIVVLLFPPEIAILSLAFLIFGDPAAAYFGIHYGRHRLPNGKSWEGILGFLTVSFLVGLVLLALFSQNHSYELSESMVDLEFKWDFSWKTIFVIFIGSLAGGLAEFFSYTTWKGLLDDNLLIPLLSAFAMAIGMAIMGGIGLDKIFFSPSLLF